MPPPSCSPSIVKPEMRCVAATSTSKHVPHVMVVLLFAVQEIGSSDDEPPLQEMTVAPISVRFLLPGRGIALDHVAVPLGMLIVSPELAAFTQAITSALEGLAATH